MNLVQEIHQYDDNCLFFCEPIKNNIMQDGLFIRLLYSNYIMTLNGICLLVDLCEFTTCEKYYNKYKYTFNVQHNAELISHLKQIEETLLHKYTPAHTNKTPQYKIYDQLMSGCIKLYLDALPKTSSGKFMLKISGIWETAFYYGVTYKFVKIVS